MLISHDFSRFAPNPETYVITLQCGLLSLTLIEFSGAQALFNRDSIVDWSTLISGFISIALLMSWLQSNNNWKSQNKR